jgi:hypothetical protein
VVVAFFGGLTIGRNSSSSAASATKEPAVMAAAARPTKPPPAASPPAASPPAEAHGTASPSETNPAGASASANAEPGSQGGNAKASATKATAPFNTKVAGQIVARAAARAAKSCKKTKTGGAGIATVTFSPTGRVDDVVISGAKVAGTPLADCVAASLRQARVPAFSGAAQTVKKPISFD